MYAPARLPCPDPSAAWQMYRGHPLAVGNKCRLRLWTRGHLRGESRATRQGKHFGGPFQDYPPGLPLPGEPGPARSPSKCPSAHRPRGSLARVGLPGHRPASDERGAAWGPSALEPQRQRARGRPRPGRWQCGLGLKTVTTRPESRPSTVTSLARNVATRRRATEVTVTAAGSSDAGWTGRLAISSD